MPPHRHVKTAAVPFVGSVAVLLAFASVPAIGGEVGGGRLLRVYARAQAWRAWRVPPHLSGIGGGEFLGGVSASKS